MAPKPKGKADAGGAVDEETLAEGKRLQSLAYEGVLSKSRMMCADEATPSKVLTKADGKDIVKKSSVRKGRYLLNINAQIAAAAAGRMGSLAQLDSRNPVLYIDFPEGRLKFLGTLMFPANKYMVLKFGAKDIVCEDILESMVVFSEAWWVGKKEENPTEAKLPLPQSLIEAGMKAGEPEANGGTQPAANGSAAKAAQREPRKRSAGEAEESSSGSEDDGGDAGGSPAVGRRMSQRSAGKRPRYDVDASDDEAGAAGSEGGQSSGPSSGPAEEADSDAEQTQRPRKQARGSQGAARGSQARRGSQVNPSQQVTEEDAAEGAAGDDADGVPRPAGTPARKRGGLKGAAGQGTGAKAAAGKNAAAAAPKRAAAKRAVSLDSEDEDDNVIDLSSPQPSQSQRPQRAAAKKPAKAARKDAGRDEDEDMEGEESLDESGEQDDDEDFSL